MPQSGFTGISFPFRISNRGGVVMSTTSNTDPTHITESVQQILSTNFLERPMESDIHSTIYSLLFEPNNETLKRVFRHRIASDLERLEKRIECDEGKIQFEIETEDDVEYLYVFVTYNIIKYNTSFTSKIRIGEANYEQNTD